MIFTLARLHEVRRRTRKAVSQLALAASLVIVAGCGETAPTVQPCLLTGFSYTCPDAVVTAGPTTLTGHEQVTVVEYNGGGTLTNEVGDPTTLSSTDDLALHSPANCSIFIYSTHGKIDEVDESCTR